MTRLFGRCHHINEVLGIIMKKIVLAAAISASLTLAGCGGGESIEDIERDLEPVRPASRIVFDPAAGVLNTPTDLLFAVVAQTDDGTLELPDEIAGEANGGTPDFGNPSAALGALDGWSTQHPFVISTEHPAGISLNAASLAAPGAVRIFEGSIGGDLNNPTCLVAPPITGCEVGDELTFGVDFVTQASGNDIVVVPLRPFDGAQSYYVVVTDSLLSSDGEPVIASTSYESLSASINDFPLATESQLALQGIINSYENVIARDTNVDPESIIFSFTFTTQVTTDIIDTVKGLQIGGFAAAIGQGADAQTAAQFLPAVVVPNEAPGTPFDVLAGFLLGEEQLAALTQVGLNSCSGLIGALGNPASPLFPTASQVFAQVGPFCASDLRTGSIDLPYYLSAAEPLTDSWRAACTNGLALQTIGAENIPGLIANGTLGVGPLNDVCQAASGGQLLDLDLTNLGITDLRHVTRFSPIPRPQGSNPDGSETLDVQITVPNETVIGLLASLSPAVQPVTRPAEGWPVVILSHGITSNKESMLALSGTLSLAGFATVAIDQPLHGTRGFTLPDGTIVNATSGAGGATTDYFNLASLLTARDNTRQGIVDFLGLRLGLNAVADLTGGSVDLDASNVFFAGQSLGSIIGTGAVAMANQSLSNVNPALAPFDGLYEIQAASFHVPGGGIASFLLESASFGNLVRGSLFAQTSPEFQAFVAQFAAENNIPVNLAVSPAFAEFSQNFTPEQAAAAEATFSAFAFAAQTVIDSSDPNNFGALLADTPVHVAEAVGGGINDDGSTALPDQVIPNTTAVPLGGTEALAGVIGLQGVGTTTPGSGIVRYTTGGHSSVLVPTPSAAVTLELQAQTAAFFVTTLQGQPTIVINNTDVIAPAP